MLWTYLLFKNLKFTECMCVDAMAYKKKVLKITKSLSITHSAQTTALPLLFCHFQDNRGGVRSFSRGGKEVFFTLSHFSTWLSILKNTYVDLVSGQNTQQFLLFQSDDNAVVQLDTFPDYGTNSFMRDSQVSKFCFITKHTSFFFSKFDDKFLWQGKPEPVLSVNLSLS